MLQELVSSRKSAMKDSIEDQSLLKDVGKSKSMRKHAQAKEETVVRAIFIFVDRLLLSLLICFWNI